MFNKEKQLTDRTPNSATLISAGTTFQGDVISETDLRVDGTIKGNIRCSAKIIIGPTGFVDGNIETKEIIVFGTIHGNIKADSIEIKSTGKIYGEINTNNLQIEKGAVYNGVLSMEPVKQLSS